MYKHSIFNICNLYILLWAIYALHWSNTMIPVVERVSNYILGVNLMISIWYSLKTIKNYKLPYMVRAINLLIFLFVIYGSVYILIGPDHIIGMTSVPVKRGTYLVSVLRSFLPIYVFYNFTIKGYLTEKIIRFWSIVFLVEFIQIYAITRIILSLISSKSDFTNNSGYLFVSILPCVYFFRKHTIIQLTIIGICMVFIISAMKRGAMLIGVLIVIMFMWEKLKSANMKEKIWAFSLFVIALCLLGVYAKNKYIESKVLQERLEKTLEGNTSHRDVLAKDFFNYYIYDANILQKILGSGADATLSISDNYAHNDWLEILICQGLLGILVYLFFWIAFYKQWKNMVYPLARNVVGAIFIIYFMRSLFSMTYSMIFTIATMCLGYSLAINRLKSNQKIYRQ